MGGSSFSAPGRPTMSKLPPDESVTPIGNWFRGAARDDAGKPCHFVEHLVVEPHGLGSVLTRTETDAGGQHAIYSDAWVDRVEPLGTPQHETRSHEEEQCHRHLTCDQQVAHLVSGSAGRVAATAVAQKHDERSAREVQHRQGAKDEARADAQRHREGEHRTVESHLVHPRQVDRVVRDQGTDSDPCHERAGGAADQCQHQALRQERSSQSPAARAEGRPDGNLSLARFSANEKQIRDVRSGDQQYRARPYPEGSTASWTPRPPASPSAV